MPADPSPTSSPSSNAAALPSLPATPHTEATPLIATTGAGTKSDAAEAQAAEPTGRGRSRCSKACHEPPLLDHADAVLAVGTPTPRPAADVELEVLALIVVVHMELEYELPVA
ncbi:hypothetical protein C8R43DRAFT_951845 [Mycena crocata]|nr:hypothetical protein C8R43DRAFT_951845 [Mycena crocata]